MALEGLLESLPEPIGDGTVEALRFDRNDVVIARSPQGDAAIQGLAPSPYDPWIAASLRSSR